MITTSIYIEVEYTQPDELFTADTTLVTADDTTHTADETLIASGEAGLKYERIELFTDEIITINSTITNFNDIGKLFADFTKSFSVPASPHNNAIFKDWYESAMGESDPDNNTSIHLVEGTAFDHRRKYNGYIEIDTIPFKFGKFTMQKANIKKGQIDSYSINFTSGISQLNDKFKDAKLNTLQGYEAYNIPYNLPWVQSTIVNSNYSLYNVHFPLIGQDHKYEYLTGQPNDVTLDSGAIKWDDLFPSLKLNRVLELIQSTYGLTFTGAIFNSTLFRNAELYCKNAEEMKQRTELKKVNFTTKTGIGTHDFWRLNLDTDTLSVWYRQEWMANPFIVPPHIDNLLPQVTDCYIRIETISTDYNFFVYNNGLPFAQYLNQSGAQTFAFLRKNYNYTENYQFTFFISSDSATFSFEATLTYRLINWSEYEGEGFYIGSYYGFAPTQIVGGNLEIKLFVPDITIGDFITGLVKKHNLMIIPKSETEFEFLPLEVFYQSGNIKDITQFITDEAIEVNRPNLYKRIDFKYQKSENILNNQYYTLNNKYYGDLWYDNPESAYTENYEIELPFENPMFERSNIEYDFFTATMIDKNQNAYVPSPTIIYNNGIQTLDTPFKWNLGTGYYVSIPQYRRYSNEIAIGGTDLGFVHSNNWGVEISPWYRDNVVNGLYFDFYSNFILNLYNQRTRVIKCKGVFNTNFISELEINDRIVLANKRYVINNMNINLSTGEVDFELLNDFREIVNNNANRYTNLPSLIIDNTEQVVNYTINLLNYDNFDVKLSGGFLSYTASTDNTNDINLEVTIPENTTGVERLDFVVLEYFKDGDSTIINLAVLQNL
jgi:hypothetical protein